MSFFRGLAQGIANGQAMAAQAEDRKRKDKLAKLQGQMLELQMKDRERMAAAREQLTQATQPQDVMGQVAGLKPNSPQEQGVVGRKPGQGIAQLLADPKNMTMLMDLMGGDPSKVLGMQKSLAEMEQQRAYANFAKQFMPAGMSGGASQAGTSPVSLFPQSAMPAATGGGSSAAAPQGASPQAADAPVEQPVTQPQFFVESFSSTGAPTIKRVVPARQFATQQGLIVMNNDGSVFATYALAPSWKKVEVTAPDGSKSVRFVDPNAGRGVPAAGAARAGPPGQLRPRSAGGGGIQIQPSTQATQDATPITLEQAKGLVRVNPETGMIEELRAGDVTQGELRENRDTIFPVDPASAKEVRKAQSALRLTGELTRMVDRIFKAEPGLAERFVEAVRIGKSTILQDHPLIETYKAARKGMSATIGRTFGNMGSYTNEDAVRTERLFASLYTFPFGMPDTQEVATQKMALLDRLLKAKINEELGHQVYDVTYPTDAEIDALDAEMDEDALAELQGTAKKLERRAMEAGGAAAKAAAKGLNWFLGRTLEEADKNLGLPPIPK